MARTKPPIPHIDLSKYSDEERLPPNIIAILRNALVVFEGDTERVAKHYKISKEKVDMIFEEYYLQIIQIIESKTRSKELDEGIDSAISLMSDHVIEIEKNKNSNIMASNTVHNLTKITDRMVTLKTQFNNTYDTLINKLIDQSIRERSVLLQENGKIEDNSEYLENQNTVARMMNQYLADKVQKKVTLINVKTYEVKTFEGDGAKQQAEEYLGCIGHLSDVARQKSPYKGEWLVQYDGKESKHSNREY